MFIKYRKSNHQLTSQNIARHYKRNMIQSAQLLKANGVSSLFILQPLLLGKSVKSALEQKHFTRFRTQRRLFWENTYLLLHQSLEILAAQEQVVWKNLQMVFKEVPEEIFNDSLHLNDRGQELLAETLFDVIQEKFFPGT